MAQHTTIKPPRTRHKLAYTKKGKTQPKYCINQILLQRTINPTEALTKYVKMTCKALNLSANTERYKRNAVEGSVYGYSDKALEIIAGILSELTAEKYTAYDLAFTHRVNTTP